MGRMIAEDDLVAEREEARRQGRIVVFTNGCFDLLHRGHAEYLAGARGLGDLLYVGVNTDASVARLKGAGRPLVPEEDRAALVAALASVDRVVLFGEDTPRRLIARLLPDVLVKGGDYLQDEVVGAAEVREAGGRVVIVPFIPGRSSSELISKILNELGPRPKDASKPLSP